MGGTHPPRALLPTWMLTTTSLMSSWSCTDRGTRSWRLGESVGGGLDSMKFSGIAGWEYIPHIPSMYGIFIPIHLVDSFMVNLGVRFFSKLAGFFAEKKTETQKVKANVFQPSIFRGFCSSFQGVFTANTSHLAMIGSKSLAKTS